MFSQARVRLALSIILIGAWAMSGLHAEQPALDITDKKPAGFANKSFNLGENKTSSFNTSNTSFGKTVETKDAGVLFSKTPSLNGRTITEPVVKMDKTYAARSYSLPGQFTGFDKETQMELKTNSYSSRTALGFNKTIETPVYLGPEGQRAKEDMATVDKKLAETKDLPDRNLSIAQVRDLLNRNKKPDMDEAKPAK